MNVDKDTQTIKIKTYRVTLAGTRGFKLTLPKVWIDDVGLLAGDKLDVYRDAEDRLIIRKAVPMKDGAA